MPILESALVAGLLYFALPRVLVAATGREAPSRALLVVAALTFLGSWYLPSPDLGGRPTAAATHFVGGGLFSGLVWAYSKQHLRWNAHGSLELISLLALVSLLGTANELFELLMVHLGVLHLSLTDTSWDLLMNTAGALTFWLAYGLVGRIRRSWRPPA